MDDVRQAAEERASRPKKAPVGASFESERQRSKNALVKQIESMDGRNLVDSAVEICRELDKVLVEKIWPAKAKHQRRLQAKELERPGAILLNGNDNQRQKGG